MKYFPRNPDELSSTLCEVQPRLDDIAVARLEARLLQLVETKGAARSCTRARNHGLRPSLLASVAALGLVAIGATVWMTRWDATDEVSPEHLAATVVSTVDWYLEPYSLSGAPARPFVHLLGKTQQTLRLPTDTLVRASLGPYARISLVGPADLRTELMKLGHQELILTKGLIAVSYQGAEGRQLQVHTPHATVVVVGTVFAVEVLEGRTIVWVSKGMVKVVSADHTFATTHIGAGNVFETDQGARTHPLDRQGYRYQFLADQEASLLAPPEDRRLLAIDGPQRGVRAYVESRLVGRTPVWALVGTDDVDVVLESSSPGEVQSNEITDDSSGSPTQGRPTTQSAPEADARQEADDLYQRAEVCMRNDNDRCARRLLKQIIVEFEGQSDALSARYDLARLEARGGQVERARMQFQELADGPQSPLTQPASYQLCKIAVDQHDSDAIACLQSFRADFPRSHLDREALTLLTTALLDRLGCAAAESALHEYVQRYPNSAYARTARQHLRRCNAQSPKLR